MVAKQSRIAADCKANFCRQRDFSGHNFFIGALSSAAVCVKLGGTKI
jgi:hypothetical protein